MPGRRFMADVCWLAVSCSTGGRSRTWPPNSGCRGNARTGGFLALLARQVDLGGEAATRTPERMVGGLTTAEGGRFGLPVGTGTGPAVCWWARAMVESTLTCRQITQAASARPRRPATIRAHTPARCQRRNSAYTACRDPQHSGTSRQGAPTRTRQRIPSMTCLFVHCDGRSGPWGAGWWMLGGMALGKQIMAMFVAASGLAGCGIEPGSGACVVTTLSVQDVQVTDPLAPLSLTAAITASGPVQGAELTFFIATGQPGEKTVGKRVGEATTGGDGVACYVRGNGVDGLAFSDERIDRYSVEYNPLNTIGNVQYCRSRADARLTVG